MKKKYITGFVCLFLCSSELVYADSSLYGVDLCPAPAITGITENLTFSLQGPTPVPGARITLVTGSCDLHDGSFPDTSLRAGGISIDVGSSYYSNAFEGLSPNIPFTLFMSYPGDYGFPTNASPGYCQINVSWTFPAPQPTPITGTGQVQIDQTVVLDGTVANVSRYNWSTNGLCSIVGSTTTATANVRGNSSGICVVTREACNNSNECVEGEFELSVFSPSMIPITLFMLLN